MQHFHKLSTAIPLAKEKPHQYASMMLDIPSKQKRLPKHLKDVLDKGYDRAVLHNFRFIKYFRKLALIDATHHIKQETINGDRLQEIYDEILADKRPVESYLDEFYDELFSRFFKDIKKQMPKEGEDPKTLYNEIWDTTMRATLRMKGASSHHHGMGTNRTRWMRLEHGRGFDLLCKIKKSIDQNNIMNPGKLYPENLQINKIDDKRRVEDEKD